MQSTLTRALVKSLLPLGLGVLHTWVKTMSRNVPNEFGQVSPSLLNPNDDHVPDYFGTFNPFWDRSSFGLDKTAIGSVSDAVNGYFWFIAIMLIIEIAIKIVSFARQKSNGSHTQLPFIQGLNKFDVPENLLMTRQSPFSVLAKFMMYVVKLIFLYSACYLFYMLILTVLCVSCNIYTHQQAKDLVQHGSVQDELEDRSPKAAYRGWSEQDKPTEGINRRLLTSMTSFTSGITPILSESEISASSIVSSSDENFMFLSRNVMGSSLQILNITNRTSPSFLGTITFLVQADERYNFPLALSPDDNTVYLSTSSTLEIINVSNLSSPTNISSYNVTDSGIIQSVTVSPDGMTVFLTTLINSGSNIEIVNVTDIQSPQLLNTVFFDAIQTYVYLSDDLMIVQYANLVSTYNISDVANPILTAPPISLGSFNNNYPLNEGTNTNPLTLSINLASDYQTAYVLQLSGNIVYMQILNISTNPATAISEQIPIFTPPSDSTASYQTQIVESPDTMHIFVIGGLYLQIFDVSNLTSPINLAPTNIQSPECFMIFSDGQTAFLGGIFGSLIAKFNLNVQARQGFSIQNNIINTINEGDTLDLQLAVLSPDGSTLYTPAYNQTYYLTAAVDVIDFSNPTSPVPLPNFELQRPPIQIAISPDGTKLVSLSYATATPVSFEIYDISDGEFISSFTFDYIDVDHVPDYEVDELLSFGIAPNCETAIVVQSLANFLILDISNSSNILLVSNVSLPILEVSTIKFSNDSQTLFLSGNTDPNNNALTPSALNIYDISTPSSPILISSFTNLPGMIAGFTLSLDENTAFILSAPESAFSEQCALSAIDISDLADPTLLVSINLPNGCHMGTNPVLIPIIPAGQALLIPLQSYLAALDVTTLNLLTIMDYNQISAIMTVIPTPDYSTLFLIGQEAIQIATLQPENILYLDSTILPLGAPYSTTLDILTRNSNNNYDAALFNYKFIDVSLYTPTVNPVTSPLTPINSFNTSNYTVLPSWMTFDENNGMITFSPNSQSQVGSYSLYASISTQIPSDAFIGVGPINNINDSSTLLTTLMMWGYVDNQGYLTSNFDPTQPLVISPEYQDFASNISQALVNYSIQALTTQYITSSLALTVPSSPSSPLSINTLSLEPLNVMITLEDNGFQPRFVSVGYLFSASFSQNNTGISMVMSLLDINNAMPQVIIFLNSSEPCDGNITITDGLNPVMNQFVPNISNYFKISSQPSVNDSYFQSQLDKVSVKTGEQFLIQFDSSTFQDLNNEPLTLSIEMQDTSLQVPDWLELKGLSLMGTPPEQLTGREIDLTLIVSNQYLSNSIGFTLDAGISVAYAFKLIGSFGGGLITVIGLLVYATTIYNILCKNRYRYSKDFIISVGQDIDSKILYPIVFAAQPLGESRLIIEYLDNKNTKELGGPSSKVKIAPYLTNPDSSHLDQEKLIKAIEESAEQMANSGKANLTLYSSGVESKKTLINQLVVNSFTIRLLDLEEEKDTKAAFNLIQKDLFSLVDLNQCLPDTMCVFSVNKARLYEKLRTYNIRASSQKVSKPKSVNLNSSKAALESFQSVDSESGKKDKSIEMDLISMDSSTRSQPGFTANIDLLAAVIEAYAFNYHIIDADILNVDIVGKQRLANIRPFERIRRFLKQDLKLIALSAKRVLGYGIKYDIEGNSIVFFGTANQEIKDETLVVQIVNSQGKILRELWIQGVDSEPEREILSEEKPL